MNYFIRQLINLLLLSSVFASDLSLAQPPDAGLLNRESSKLPQPPKPPTVNLIEKPESVRPALLPDAQLRVTVKHFRMSGNTQFSEAELQDLVKDSLNHEINFAELEAVVKRIVEHYRQAGFFLATAYLPQQSIKQGIVEIIILEGQVDGSHLSTDTVQALTELRLNKSVLTRFLETYEEGEVLTEQNLNRLSLLLNDLPGIESSLVLSAGQKKGSSVLGIKVKEGALMSGYALTDNHGLYATGYYHFDGTLSLNDPSGYGDLLNLRIQTTETGKSVGGWADYTLPINGYGTRLAMNVSQLEYRLGGSFKNLQAHGVARTVGASLTHPFWLTRSGRLSGTAHYEHRWLEDNLDSTQNRNHRELDVMSFSVAGNLYDQVLITTGLTQINVGVSAGEVRFNNPAAYIQDQLIHSNGGYHKFSWQFNRLQNLIENFSLYANFQGQIASKNLDSSERFSLGGPNAIRAYPVGEGSASEGWLINAETRYVLPKLFDWQGNIQILGFIDSGYSRINVRPFAGQSLNGRHLTGYGFGVNWSDRSGFNLRTSVAWRDVHQQPTSDATASGPMVYFQLSQSL